jgi:hypothetical protein
MRLGFSPALTESEYRESVRLSPTIVVRACALACLELHASHPAAIEGVSGLRLHD